MEYEELEQVLMDHMQRSEPVINKIGETLTPHWTFSIVIPLVLLFVFGFLISIIRRVPVQRTWVLTLFPYCLLCYILLMDGEFLSSEICKFVAIICIVSSILWYLTNLIDKKVGKIMFKKGDMEASIDNTFGIQDNNRFREKILTEEEKELIRKKRQCGALKNSKKSSISPKEADVPISDSS